jgi:hypothetical protein
MAGDFDVTLDEKVELRLRQVVVPAALVLAWLVTGTGGGRMLGRIFLSMWVHEIGHAVAAWFSGIAAFPGPWVTPMGSSRSVVVFFALAGALVGLGYHGYRTERRARLVVAGILLSVQVVCTLLVPFGKAMVFITFCGDGGAMVLGTLLMASFYVGAEHPLRTRWLRWGFVVIGAFAFADPTRTWWAARHDIDAIPFGFQENAGLSDPSRLETWGWSATAMTDAYLRLTAVCLLTLAVVHLVGVRQAHRRARPVASPPAP